MADPRNESSGGVYLLFENPWPAAVCLVAVAVTLFMVGRRTERPRQQAAAAVPLLLAVAIPVLATVVTTQREALKQRTREMIEAAVPPVDREALEGLLADNVRFFDMSKSEILAAAERAADQYSVSGYGLRYLKALPVNAKHGRTRFAIFTHLEGGVYRGPVPSKWTLKWQREERAWRVTRIEWRSLSGRDVQRRHLP